MAWQYGEYQSAKVLFSCSETSLAQPLMGELVKNQFINLCYLPLMGIVHIQRHRADLDCISIICRIFKKTVVRVKNLTG